MTQIQKLIEKLGWANLSNESKEIFKLVDSSINEVKERITTLEDVTPVSSELPYKVYTAILTQTGTSAPVAIILENTIGDIVWVRDEEGYYNANLAGAFVTDKTVLFHGDSNESGQFETIEFYQDAGEQDYIWLESSINSVSGGVLIATYTDGIVRGISVEIRVYN